MLTISMDKEESWYSRDSQDFCQIYMLLAILLIPWGWSYTIEIYKWISELLYYFTTCDTGNK